jgi:hypothetical protein
MIWTERVTPQSARAQEVMTLSDAVAGGLV